MSTGLVICSVCHKEVHQDGPQHTWRHCSRFHDWTPICEGGHPIYPVVRQDIVGLFCQADGFAPPPATSIPIG
jgi:hypothetical protein